VEKWLLWGPTPLPRKPHCLVLLTFVFCLFLSDVCSAETQSFRDEARSTADRLRAISPPAKLLEEYGNILATFDTADELSLKNKPEVAEKLYQLVLVEFSIFNKKFHPLDTSSAGIQTPASPVPSPRPTSSVLQDAGSVNVTIGKVDRVEDVEEEESPISSPLMVGKEFVYTVKKSESLRMVGAKLGVGWRAIVRENDLDPKKPLEPGQELVINTRRIIPKTLREGILINIPDRTMYLFKDNKLEKAVPVALGMPAYQDHGDWRTPTGHFRILSKMKNPTWHVPLSIRTEMKQSKRKVLTVVPPGGDNPLGKYALMTSLSGILIHSTTRPESIYNFASHGCIRVNPKNMEEIYPEIPVHSNGEIVYQPVKLAFSDDGRIFIEVHGDIYKHFKKLDEVAKGLIIKNKAEQRVDWDKVRTLLRRKSGIPEDVTLEGSERE
jgi:L,D-transpeptidase ErfK/SrfK